MAKVLFANWMSMGHLLLISVYLAVVLFLGGCDLSVLCFAYASIYCTSRVISLSVMLHPLRLVTH